MRKKKIVFITPGIETGGAEKQLALLAKGLSKDDFAPLIIVLSQSKSGKRLSDFDGLKVIEFDCRKLFRRASVMWRIRQVIKDQRPDIIQGWMYAGNIVASIAGIGTGARIYHSLRATNMDSKRYGRTILFNAILSRYADGVISNSQTGVAHHVSFGFLTSKMSVIPNGIDTNKFVRNKELGQKFRRKLGIPEDARLVLYAARIDPMKDHQKVISIAKLCPSIQFVLAGEGTKILNVPSNVKAVGLQQNMHQVYNACDLLLSLSRFGEGFPNVIGEAMACGVPVYANNIGDSWQVIGDVGHRLESNILNEVADELSSLVVHRPSTSDKKRIANYISKNFSIVKMVASYSSLYSQNDYELGA